MTIDIAELLSLIKKRQIESQKVVTNVMTAGAILLEPDTRLKYVHEAAYYIRDMDELFIEIVDMFLGLATENELLKEKIGYLEGRVDKIIEKRGRKSENSEEKEDERAD